MMSFPSGLQSHVCVQSVQQQCEGQREWPCVSERPRCLLVGCVSEDYPRSLLLSAGELGTTYTHWSWHCSYEECSLVSVWGVRVCRCGCWGYESVYVCLIHKCWIIPFLSFLSSLPPAFLSCSLLHFFLSNFLPPLPPSRHLLSSPKRAQVIRKLANILQHQPSDPVTPSHSSLDLLPPSLAATIRRSGSLGRLHRTEPETVPS